MMFIAGVQLRYFAALFGSLIVILPLAWQYLLADYQKNRILNMFNPESDPLGAGFTANSGEKSPLVRENGLVAVYLPPRVYSAVWYLVQESDFIFSVASEQLGFFGAMAILILIVLLLLSHHECSQKILR